MISHPKETIIDSKTIIINAITTCYIVIAVE